jgi:hypothetical protein
MTILLLILLVVYLVAVSAPTSIRLVGLVLARNRSSEPPVLWGSTTARLGALKSGTRAAREWPQRDSRDCSEP